MNEYFLQYIWQHQYYNFIDAKTTDGKKITISRQGILNHDSGPDFLHAEIYIDGIKWIGNVEIHINSSDWFKHKHQFDDKYKSVILHVVYNHDMNIQLSENEKIPTLELKNLINYEMFNKYTELLAKPDLLSCRNYLQNVDSLIVNSQLSRVLIERLTKKQHSALSILETNKNDWNDLIYKMLAIAFGCKINSFAFEMLTQNLPFKILHKHRESSLQLDALLFGMSGFLNVESKSDYMQKLIYEFDYLKYKYNLSPIPSSVWNLLRLRPRNFPTLRIAQFSGFLKNVLPNISHHVLKSEIPELKKLFLIGENIDDYWNYHYLFEKETTYHSISLGEQTINSVIINTIIPLRFLHSKYYNDVNSENIVQLFDEIPFENNKYTRIFQNCGIKFRNAGDSQALIELLKEYCIPKRCLKCSIGEKIVRDIKSCRAE